MPVSIWITAVLAAGLFGCIVPGWADVAPEREPPPAREAGIAYKFTPTFYRTTHVTPAYDLNLRGNRDAHTAWVGYYQLLE